MGYRGAFISHRKDFNLILEELFIFFFSLFMVKCSKGGDKYEFKDNFKL